MATLLIVEDDATLRFALKERLTQAGYGLLEAKDGVEGLSVAQERQPDLILLDIKMPNMSGFEMLKKLRGDGAWGAKVPVIFFTNIEPSSDDELADIEALGPADYVIKSNTDLDDIVEKVRNFVS